MIFWLLSEKCNGSSWRLDVGIWEPTRLRKPFSRYGQNTYCIGFDPNRSKPISSFESMDWHLSCTLEPHSAAALSLSVGCGSTRSQRALRERLPGATFTDLGGAATERQETAAASTHPRVGSFAVHKCSTVKNHRFVAAEPC